MEDDPFAVIAPSEKKMSTYLKKSKGASTNKCVETSSHGTNSTTNSTIPPEDSSFFTTKVQDQSSKKSSTSGFHNSSSSSGSANFAFGNGLEFGQDFGNLDFGDDGFGTSSQGGSSKQERKPQSARNISSVPDPFLDPPPVAPQSMRNFGSTRANKQDRKSHRKSQSSENFGSSSDSFLKSPSTAPEPSSNFGSGTDDGFDAFGASDPFGSSDPFGGENTEFDAFGHEEDINFGDEGFGTNVFASDTDPAAWEKREEWKKTARSRSDDVNHVPKRSQSQKRRGGMPRKHRSTDDVKGLALDARPNPRRRASSRKKPARSRQLDGSHHPESPKPSPRKTKEESLRARESREKSPIRRTRSGQRPSRRSTMDQSGHTESSDTKSHTSESQSRRRPPRRTMVAHTSSNGSLDPANLGGVPAVRGKSSVGPAHRPNRRQQRAGMSSSLSSIDSTALDRSSSNVEDDKEKDWDHERSKNQQVIMNMYRDDGLSANKSEDNSNNSSISELGKYADMIGLSNEVENSSGSPDGSRGRRKKKNDKGSDRKESEGYSGGRDSKDRTKGSLLDRVVVPSVSRHESIDSQGLSYSDRILKARERSKGN